MEKAVKRYAPIFVLPTFLAFVIGFILPFIEGLYLSFCQFTTVKDAKFIGIGNYQRIFTDSTFTNSFKFTVLFAVASIVQINVIAFILALLLTRKLKGTNIFRTIFFMPNLIGGIVLGYIWQLLINGVLAHFNVTITADPKYGFWGMVILTNWQLIGYMMIIYIAGIQNIPTELIEAAEIDGANKFQTLYKIIIPMTMPSVTICLFLTLTNCFKLFDQNLALTAGGPAKKTAMLAYDIYTTFYNRNGWEGVGQAKAVIFFIIVAAISLTQLYFTRRKEVEN